VSPEAIAESTEFVCERWGKGEEWIAFYAPVTRLNGALWIHPTWMREYRWEDLVRRATRVWLISGSFWNPGGFRLIHRREPAQAAGVMEGGRE